MTVPASLGQPIASVPQSSAEICRPDDTVRKESVAPGSLNQAAPQSVLLDQHGSYAAPVQNGTPVHPGATIPAWRLGEGDTPATLRDPPSGAADIPAAWTGRVPPAEHKGRVVVDELPLLGKTGVIEARDAAEFVRQQIVGYGSIQIGDRLADRRLDYQHVNDMFTGMTTKLIPVLVAADVKVLWTDTLSSDQPLVNRILARQGGPSEQDWNELLRKVGSDHKTVPDLSTRLKSELRFLKAAHEKGIEIRVLKKGEQPVRTRGDEGTFVVLGGSTKRDRPFLDVDATGVQGLALGQIKAFDDKTSVMDVRLRLPSQAPAPRTSPAPAAPGTLKDI